MLFHDRYQIVRCLAAGGMGAVYECVHLTTQKHRALKVMLPQMLAAAGMRERFELEARVTAQIDSEHIVETFDAGVDPATGAPFLVMELLRGEDLESMLRARGPFAPEETVLLLSQAALALDRTHAAGIVHRDLKPQNLFWTTRDDGSPRLKILDFGIAKVVADGSKTALQTAALGTPVYMAPEQTTGDSGIGPSADLFALGHIAYALLVGEAYWMGELRTLPVYGLLSMMLAGPVEPATARAARRGVALPPAFDAWFQRATAKLAQDRFESASAQIAELAASLATPAPRLLLAAPPVLARYGPPPSSPGFLPPLQQPALPSALGSAQILSLLAEQGQAAGVAPVALASQPFTAGPHVATGASAPLDTSGHTAGALANGPVLAPAASSRLPLAALVAVVTIATAAGTATVVRGLRGRHGDRAVATAGVAASVEAPVLIPPTAATTPTVEPESRASAAPTVSAAPVKALPPAPPPKPSVSPKVAVNCNPPFTVDASGARHAKPECL